MSSFSYYANPIPAPVSHNHHGNRRRGNGPARLAMNPSVHKQQLPLHPTQSQQHHHHQQQQQQQHHLQQMLRGQARAAIVSRDLLPDHLLPEPPVSVSTANVSQYRHSLEQWISFDLDDDLEFCPNLVVDDDLLSHSSHSERSSQASDSPGTSPLQMAQTIPAGFLRSFQPSRSPNYSPPSFHADTTGMLLNMPTPAPTRAIAIIDPTTGIPVSSPSTSPSRMPRTFLTTSKW